LGRGIYNSQIKYFAKLWNNFTRFLYLLEVAKLYYLGMSNTQLHAKHHRAIFKAAKCNNVFGKPTACA
jgi:hypothetical protein